MKNRILIILFLIFSCENNRNKDISKFTITDFSNERIDTLKPLSSKSYNSFYIKVNGFSNGTIKIKRKGYYDINLSGSIDTLINGDYYGTENIIWVFEPYKATKGKLKIEYGL